MTLRLRLVLALVVLVLAGLGLFGVATYSVYAHSQYQRLDDQIRSSVPFVTRQLTESSSPTEKRRFHRAVRSATRARPSRVVRRSVSWKNRSPHV